MINSAILEMESGICPFCHTKMERDSGFDGLVYRCTKDLLRAWMTRGELSVFRIYWDEYFLRVIKYDDKLMQLYKGDGDQLNIETMLLIKPFEIFNYNHQELGKKLKMISVFS